MKEIQFAWDLDEAGMMAACGIREGKTGAVIVRTEAGDLISFYGETMGAVTVTPKDAALPEYAGEFRTPSENKTFRRWQLLYEAALLLFAGGGAYSLLEAADRLRPCFTEAENVEN